jgi:SAM-dependent methyltransferase
MRAPPGQFASNLMVDVVGIPPEQATDPDACREFVSLLVSTIGMHPHGDPRVEHFGEGKLAGWTVAQLIETSHIVAHFMDPTESMDGLGGLHLDLSSCGLYSPSEVVWFILNRWPGCEARASECPRTLAFTEEPRPINPYDRLSSQYDRFYGRGAVHEFEDNLVASLLPYRSLSHLDIGCGTGFASRVQDTAPPLYVGIDPSSAMLDRWHSHDLHLCGSRYIFGEWAESGDREVELRLGTAGDAGILDCLRRKYDLVTALWSLNYMTPAELCETFSSLVPKCEDGCRMILASYRPRYLRSPDYIAKNYDTPRHIHHPSTLIKDAERFGWELGGYFRVTGPIARATPLSILQGPARIADSILFGADAFNFDLYSFNLESSR